MVNGQTSGNTVRIAGLEPPVQFFLVRGLQGLGNLLGELQSYV